jgi:photosystem II stability/assembly factor-like uncharacterized protein
VLQAPNKLFRTSDGGRTWQLVSRPSIWGPITFVNNHTAFAGGPGQMIIGPYIGPPIITPYRTTDGGRTWSKYNIARSDSFVELPIRVFGSQVVLAQNAPNRGDSLNLNPGTVDISPDGGHTWVTHVVPFGPGGLPASFSAVSPSVWALSSRSDLFTTRDAGRHWRKIGFGNLPRNAQVQRPVAPPLERRASQPASAPATRVEGTQLPEDATVRRHDRANELPIRPPG